jgi:hypothetical protein
MGPFSGAQFTVQVSTLNRSRPSLTTHFKIPFNQLNNSMQVMHRTGFLINSISDGTERHTENMAAGTKKRQPESPKSNTKKTNSRRRLRKNS